MEDTLLSSSSSLILGDQRSTTMDFSDGDGLLQKGTSVGFTNDEMVELIKYLRENVKNASHSLKILKVLYPNEQVGGGPIVELLTWFPTAKFSIKKFILKWLILVNRQLSEEGTEFLYNMYGILFHYIDYETTRNYLCRLLYMLTRRKDVTKYRVERLSSLTRNLIESGQDSSELLVICDLFARYAPDIVGKSLPKRFSRPSSSFFRCPDDEMRRAMNRVRHVSRVEVQTPLQAKKNAKFYEKEKKKKSKKRKSLVIPVAEAKKARLEETNLQEINSSEKLGTALKDGTLVLPDRCSSILRDTMFQYLLCLDPKEDQILRLRHTLPYLIEDEFFSIRKGAVQADSTSKENDRKIQYQTQKQLLVAMVDFCDFVQQIIPEMEQFIVRFLETWNGVDHFEEILTLISHLQPVDYQTFYREILRPIYRVYKVSGVTEKSRIIQCFRFLVLNWAEIDWDQHIQKGGSSSILPRFHPIPGSAEFFNLIFELIKYVDQMLVVGLTVNKDDPLLQVATGHFYGMVAKLYTNHKLPFVIPPSPGLTYKMLLAPTSIGPCIMGDILVQYKDGFKELREYFQGMENTKDFENSGLNKIGLYNSFIWDYCNTLWRNKPLPSDTTTKSDNENQHTTKSLLFKQAVMNGLVDKMQNELQKGDIARAFGVTHGLAFLGFATEFVHSDPELSTINDLKGDKKVEYLEFLQKEKKCNGLVNFMNNFISNLASRKN